MNRAIRREQGSALLITVMIMVLMGLLGIAALDTVTRDQQVAGFQKRSQLALYAAEAGVADAKDRLRGVFDTGSPGPQIANFPDPATAVSLGDAATFPYGQPRYFGDPPAGGDAIEYMNAAQPDLEGGSNQRQGGSQWFNTLWRIRVQGQTPDGANSRLEVVATKQLSGGNAY